MVVVKTELEGVFGGVTSMLWHQYCGGVVVLVMERSWGGALFEMMIFMMTRLEDDLRVQLWWSEASDDVMM